MTTTRRYYDLTEAEKASLTTEQFTDSVKLEGLHRGIKPPVTLSDALKNLNYVGFRIPPDAVNLFELVSPSEYNGSVETGICYRTSEQATAALAGAIRVNVDYNKKVKIIDGNFSVRERWVSLAPGVDVAAKLEQYQQDDQAFYDLSEECSADLSELRQRAYNKKVRAERRTEYLRLAGGDVAIATAFWSKSEGTAFPNEAGE